MTAKKSSSNEPVQMGESIITRGATIAELKANAGPRPKVKPAQAYFSATTQKPESQPATPS
jgi:hypothetical protein